MAKLKRTELAEVINRLVSQSKNQKHLAKEIAGYLVETHQIQESEALIRNITSLRQEQGMVEATVTTAFPVSAPLENQLKTIIKSEYPHATQISLYNQVEPEVLSGVVIETIDRQLDQTARGKLNKLMMATKETA